MDEELRNKLLKIYIVGAVISGGAVTIIQGPLYGLMVGIMWPILLALSIAGI